MIEIQPVSELCESLDLWPDGNLAVRNKFITGTVTDTHGTYFIKVVRSDLANPESVCADLQNEVNWNNFAVPALAEFGFRVPTVVCADEDNRWVLFEHLKGSQLDESEFPVVLGRLANLGVAISSLSLGREPSDLTSWYMGRLNRFRPLLDDGFVDNETIALYDRILDGSVDLSDLKAGIIHGDLNPKNILTRADDPEIGLVDAEFGTTPEKPEWDKPRLHDVAYIYHLLLCQYHNSDMAEQFLIQAQHAFSQHSGFDPEIFNRELNLSLLERTVSMSSHFVLNKDPSKTIDDSRRTEPQPYAELIRKSLEVIV